MAAHTESQSANSSNRLFRRVIRNIFDAASTDIVFRFKVACIKLAKLRCQKMELEAKGKYQTGELAYPFTEIGLKEITGSTT